jgi:hypothetical protein
MKNLYSRHLITLTSTLGASLLTYNACADSTSQTQVPNQLQEAIVTA